MNQWYNHRFIMGIEIIMNVSLTFAHKQSFTEIYFGSRYQQFSLKVYCTKNSFEYRCSLENYIVNVGDSFEKYLPQRQH